MLLDSNPVSIYLASSLIGFSAGTAIGLLLFVLTVRAGRLPGTRAASLFFVACCLAWNLGGLSHAIALTWGSAEQERAALTFLAVQFTAAACWPIAVLAMWSPLATQSWQKVCFRMLQIFAVLSGLAIGIPLWYAVFASLSYKTLLVVKESTAYNGAILLTLGIALFRDRLVSRPMRIPSLAMLVGVFGATFADVIQQVLPFNPAVCSVLHAVSEQLTLFIVLGAFFLFGRIRFSDLFIRNSVRALLAVFTAVAFMLVNVGLSSLRFEDRAAFPRAARMFAEVLAAVALLFLFRLADGKIGECVDRWIFRAPDYRSLLRQLAETLVQLRDDSAVAEAVETAAQRALELRAVKLIPIDSLHQSASKDTVAEGELVEVDCQDRDLLGLAIAEVELLVPVRTEGRVGHVMAVAPGFARRGLVTHEVNFLRSAAAQFGHRLDALRTEERTVEAQSREAVLQQQVTEAELRALRAQINPHFLFNSLNSIANLVMTNPEKAEAMTMRLARVFRHVLANSSRPLNSLHEEIEFLQTYLEIEEARFGDRLHVEISVDPEVANQPIPSLILQPIVENALKHGLARKPGPGHLWITADTEGNQVRLRVEDDGVGPGNGARQNGSYGQSKGVGLENVALRLNALYQEQSRMTFERGRAGGTRVTILLPRETPA